MYLAHCRTQQQLARSQAVQRIDMEREEFSGQLLAVATQGIAELTAAVQNASEPVISMLKTACATGTKGPREVERIGAVGETLKEEVAQILRHKTQAAWARLQERAKERVALLRDYTEAERAASRAALRHLQDRLGGSLAQMHELELEAEASVEQLVQSEVRRAMETADARMDLVRQSAQAMDRRVADTVEVLLSLLRYFRSKGPTPQHEVAAPHPQARPRDRDRDRPRHAGRGHSALGCGPGTPSGHHLPAIEERGGAAVGAAAEALVVETRPLVAAPCASACIGAEFAASPQSSITTGSDGPSESEAGLPGEESASSPRTSDGGQSGGVEATRGPASEVSEEGSSRAAEVGSVGVGAREGSSSSLNGVRRYRAYSEASAGDSSQAAELDTDTDTDSTPTRRCTMRDAGTQAAAAQSLGLRLPPSRHGVAALAADKHPLFAARLCYRTDDFFWSWASSGDFRAEADALRRWQRASAASQGEALATESGTEA